MGERLANPCFKTRLLGRHESALWKPGSEQPVQSPHLQVYSAANFDFRDLHRCKFDQANFTIGNRRRDFYTDVVATVLVRYDFRVVPHVAEPLTIRQATSLSPQNQPLRSAHDPIPAEGLLNPDIGDVAWRKSAETDLEPIRVGAGF